MEGTKTHAESSDTNIAMTRLDERLLESKMTGIEQVWSWSPRVISKFEPLVRSGDELVLYRVNPLAFARDRAIAEGEAIDLFLYATRYGSFDMSWDVLCPQSAWCSTASVRCVRSRRITCAAYAM
jgi:Family of unknown function (DUF5939)